MHELRESILSIVLGRGSDPRQRNGEGWGRGGGREGERNGRGEPLIWVNRHQRLRTMAAGMEKNMYNFPKLATSSGKKI